MRIGNFKYIFLGNQNKKTTTSRFLPKIGESNNKIPNLFTTEAFTAINSDNSNTNQNDIDSSDNSNDLFSTISINDNITEPTSITEASANLINNIDKGALEFTSGQNDDSTNKTETINYFSFTENNLANESSLDKTTSIPIGEVKTDLAVDTANQDVTDNQNTDLTDKPFTLNLLQDSSSDNIVILGSTTTPESISTAIGSSTAFETSTSVLETSFSDSRTSSIRNPSNETEQNYDITDTTQQDDHENIIKNEITNGTNATQQQRTNDRANIFLDNDSAQEWI